MPSAQTEVFVRQAIRGSCLSVFVAAVVLVPSPVLAQETPQALRQDIDQLRRDVDSLMHEPLRAQNLRAQMMNHAAKQ